MVEASVLGCRMVVLSKEERLGDDDIGREEAKQVCQGKGCRNLGDRGQEFLRCGSQWFWAAGWRF